MKPDIKKRWTKVPDKKWNEVVARMKAKEAHNLSKTNRVMSIFQYPSFTTTIDATRKCFKMFDGAAKLTLIKMSTPDMKELVGVLTDEMHSRTKGN